MNDNWWVFPVAGLTLAAIILLVLIGGKMEKLRIYNNCLDKNGTLLYTDAVKLCKEIVK
jgi:hypothetical protein